MRHLHKAVAFCCVLLRSPVSCLGRHAGRVVLALGLVVDQCWQLVALAFDLVASAALTQQSAA